MKLNVSFYNLQHHEIIDLCRLCNYDLKNFQVYAAMPNEDDMTYNDSFMIEVGESDLEYYNDIIYNKIYNKFGNKVDVKFTS